MATATATTVVNKVVLSLALQPKQRNERRGALLTYINSNLFLFSGYGVGIRELVDDYGKECRVTNGNLDRLGHGSLLRLKKTKRSAEMCVSKLYQIARAKNGGKELHFTTASRTV